MHMLHLLWKFKDSMSFYDILSLRLGHVSRGYVDKYFDKCVLSSPLHTLV